MGTLPTIIAPNCTVGQLVKKPVNNFSEDELYPPKPSPVHNPPFPPHTATSPLAHKHTSTIPTSLDSSRLTSSLPVHLTGAISSPDDRQSEELPNNGTRHEPELQSESSDTHCGSLLHSLPPVVDVHVDTSANSNNVPEMAHHRNNSDFFVTPSSSPPASPRLPARVGNRTPSRTAIVTQRSLQTFFSKSPKKFEDILLVENNQIPTVDFLECCRAVIPFFGKFHYTSSVGLYIAHLEHSVLTSIKYKECTT